MAVTTVASVHELSAVLLDQCEAVLATTVGGAYPAAATFLSPGLPALDRQCDTLAVYATGPQVQGQQTSPPGITGASLRFGWRYFVGISALAARCIPVAQETTGGYKVPSAAQLTLAAEKVQEDMWALLNGIAGRVDDIFEEHPCEAVQFVGLSPLDPQGGFGGWVLDLQVELTGYTVSV